MEFQETWPPTPSTFPGTFGAAFMVGVKIAKVVGFVLRVL
jgi:hypothetical protein